MEKEVPLEVGTLGLTGILNEKYPLTNICWKRLVKYEKQFKKFQEILIILKLRYYNSLCRMFYVCPYIRTT